MRWSFSLLRAFNIDLRVHITFPLILLLGAVQWGSRFGAPGAAFGVILMALLFVCVVLHELAHSPVREIVLLPIGGVARMEKNPEKPLHELLISLAGPLTNFVIAGVLLGVTRASPTLRAFRGEDLFGPDAAPPGLPALLYWLLSANIVLGLFNLVPAYPMDGGRVLRAGLSMFLGQRRATRIASIVAQIIATLMGAFGVVSGNFMLALIALFIFASAGQERFAGQATAVLKTLRVGDAYNKYALTLAPGDHLSTVVDYILTSYQPDYAVLHGGDLIGIVTRDDVLRALASDPRDLYVSGIMQREVPRVSAQQTLEDVRQTLAGAGKRVAAVYEGSGDRHYLGLVSLEDIQEALLVASFVERQQQLRGLPSAG